MPEHWEESRPRFVDQHYLDGKRMVPWSACKRYLEQVVPVLLVIRGRGIVQYDGTQACCESHGGLISSEACNPILMF